MAEDHTAPLAPSTAGAGSPAVRGLGALENVHPARPLAGSLVAQGEGTQAQAVPDTTEPPPADQTGTPAGASGLSAGLAPSSPRTVAPSSPARPTRDLVDSQTAIARPTGGETPGSPPVAAGPVTAPVVSTPAGDFTIHLGGAASTDGAQQPTRSEFVASNAVLTAAISRPCNEGNGTYSVTAMLNPPSLGHVQAVVKVDGANVSVVIVAHTPEGHHAIASHLEELRTELEAGGGDVQLSLSDGGSKGRQRGQDEPPAAIAHDTEDSESLVLAIAPAQAGKSLHVIL